MNQRIPSWSKTAVLRLTLAPGSSNDVTSPLSRVDPDQGIEPAVSQPRRSIGADDDPVRSGARRPSGISVTSPRGRVEATESPIALTAVPNGSIRGRRHIVGPAARRHWELDHLRHGQEAGGRCRGAC